MPYSNHARANSTLRTTDPRARYEMRRKVGHRSVTAAEQKPDRAAARIAWSAVKRSRFNSPSMPARTVSRRLPTHCPGNCRGDSANG